MKKNLLFQKIAHLSLLITIIFSTTSIANATPIGGGNFGGGDGSPGTPYQIIDCLDLQAVGSHLTSSFVLSNDIDCSATQSWNSGAGFAPIGNSGSYFTGELNGNGHVITSLYINRSSSGYVGMISFMGAAGSVHDIGLVDASVTGSAYTGALFGQNISGAIARVFTTGAVHSNSYAGGIVGLANGGTITDSYSRATVSGDTYQGGIIGLAVSNVAVDNVYATGQNSATFPGGLVGNNGSGTYTDSFYDSQTTGASDDAGNGKPKTSVQMKSVATFTLSGTAGLTTPWDFVGNPNNDVANSDIWNIDASLNDGYPYLSWQSFDTTAPTITNVTSSATDGSYKAGSVLAIQVTFSEVVVSTGSVTVTLETGVTDRTCTFTVFNASSGSCNYTVQAGDTSLDLTTNSISGTLRDAWGNSMNVFTPTTNLAANKAIVIDTAVPTITLTGSAAQSLTQGDSFTDAGATASDAIDGTITSNIVVTGSVNSNAPAIYTLIYNVSDAAGNAATAVQRIVTVNGLNHGRAVIPSSIDGSPLTVLINGVDSPTNETHTGTIQLTFNADNSVNEYVISDNPDFTNSSRVAYAPSTTITIPHHGTTQFYIKFFSTTNNSSNAITKTIVYSDAPTSVTSPIILTVTSTPKVVSPTPENNQITAVPTSAAQPVTTQFVFTRNLKKGMSGSDVRELQKYLNECGATVATSGPGSAGNETKYFGTTTARAVITFQQQHAAKILAPLGLKTGTGSFLTSTRTFINNEK
ncbi:MAG: DUF5011 domain-containing protein [Candidatus Magasanikbacteria bacterium]|nr:DUF5011 domain-containing protein [Candidatus Magasanikbacteria bacterium]